MDPVIDPIERFTDWTATVAVAWLAVIVQLASLVYVTETGMRNCPNCAWAVPDHASTPDALAALAPT